MKRLLLIGVIVKITFSLVLAAVIVGILDNTSENPMPTREISVYSNPIITEKLR